MHGGGFGVVGGGFRDEDVRAAEGNDGSFDASLLGGVSDASRGRELRRDGADSRVRVHGGAWANLESFFSPRS